MGRRGFRKKVHKLFSRPFGFLDFSRLAEGKVGQSLYGPRLKSSTPYSTPEGIPTQVLTKEFPGKFSLSLRSGCDAGTPVM